VTPRWPLPFVLVALAACSGRASEAECDRAVDRMIAIFTAPRIPEGGKVAEEAQQDSDTWRKNLTEKDPTRAVLMQACTTQMTSGQVSCVVNALDEQMLAACFGG
jgi:hypothetical protein